MWRRLLRGPAITAGLLAVMAFALVVPAGQLFTDRPGAAVRPTPDAPVAPEFLQARGKDLVYRNATVVLKGTNFDNIAALGAGIGSGNVHDISFGPADYAELSRHGANHVRFGLSFNWYRDSPDDFFGQIDRHVGWATEHNLWLVFNMYTTPGDCYEGYGTSCIFWQSASEQEQLRDFWVAMASRYRGEPAVAGYDLLNEPTPPGDCAQWFAIAGHIRDAVAAVAPHQLVFVETCADPRNDLERNGPLPGRNIVYEAHDFSPMDMSHDMYSPGSIYPGEVQEWFGACFYDQATFAGQGGCTEGNIRERFGLDWAEQHDVPLYIGEWGATSRLNGYVEFHQDKAELYQRWNVNHAHYTWKHQTIRTGGEYQWGIYATPLRLDDPAKLEAVKIAWQGAVRPQFGPI